jgi:hypothetical protein
MVGWSDGVPTADANWTLTGFDVAQATFMVEVCRPARTASLAGHGRRVSVSDGCSPMLRGEIVDERVLITGE